MSPCVTCPTPSIRLPSTATTSPPHLQGRPQNYGAGVQKATRCWLNYVNTVLQDAMSGATYQSYIDAFEQWFGVKLDPPKTGKPAMYC